MAVVTATKTRQHSTRSTAPVEMVAIDEISPCPENAQLYRPVDPKDPDIRDLADGIREHGVLDPLVITEDYFILSGRRRRTAAILAGLTHVPCRIEPIRYDNCDFDEIIVRLREHNRQRVKTLDEMIREEVVSVDPYDAYDLLLDHRAKRSDMSDRTLDRVKLSPRRGRKRISAVKQEMLDAVLRAIEGRRKFWPLSDRQIHYLLLNDPPLRNTGRSDSRYGNDGKSYHDLCDLLTRARLAGQIVSHAIADETRPTTHWNHFANPQDFVRKELAELFKGYARDLQQSQPNHIEIVAEKLTVRRIVEDVACRYGLPVTIGRGYCSIMPRHAMSRRFHDSGKDRLIVLIVSDLDPDGESISESFLRSMRDDFGIEELVPIKAALTAKQVKELALTPGMQAKKSSSQYKKFKQQYGTADVYELEAVPPDELQRLLREAIGSVLDVDLFDREVEAERNDAAFLEEARQRATLALRNV